MTASRPPLIVWPAALMAILLQACAGHPTYERGLRVKYADEAGSVSISPTAVTAWDDVAGDLQPSFKMDSATAFNNAIPNTQSLDERLSDLLSANLQVGLPTRNVTRITNQDTNSTTGDIDTVVDNTTTRQSGARPGAVTLAPGTAATLAALGATNLGDDPILRYLAATALQQEVALLNRYVRDRIRWPGAQAFVVQLQLSVMPNGRSMPYDVETDVTLHADDEQARARLAYDLQLPNDPDRSAPAPRVCAPGTRDTLQVLPMIVTDNLEGLRAARTTDNIRQLALALVGTAGNVGAAGQFGRTIEELRRTEGRDTNSLFTIARLSDDTVRIRLGAVQSPRFGYVTVPRNHRISLVVIYRPCLREDRTGYDASGTRVITAVSRTAFRDAQSGQVLEYQNSTRRLADMIASVQQRFVGQFDYLELARMYQWATRQERERFFDYVVNQHLQASMCRPNIIANLLGAPRAYRTRPEDYDNLAEPDDYILQDRLRGEVSRPPSANSTPAARRVPEALDATRDARCLTLARMRYEMVAAPLWTQLQSIRPTLEFAFTNVPITLRELSPTLPPRQLALLNFGQNESGVTLTQGQDLAGLADVQLVLIGSQEGAIPATTTTVSPNGRAISATFPPLGRFGITASQRPTAAAPTTAAAGARTRGRSRAGEAPAARSTAPPPTYVLELRVPRRPRMPRPCASPLPSAEDNSSLALWRSGEVRLEDGACFLSYPVWLVNASAPASTSPFSIDASASGIIANPATGTGRLIVTITRSGNVATPPETLFLSVEGAQLVSAQVRGGAAVAREGRGWRVTGPGDLILELENLIPNTLVKVNLRDGETSAGSVSRSVIAAVATRTAP
ncbi:MAG TPA: hypothetical protein VMG08_15170 [Allosphingosinicella sp.]|nr:hypothetical protein [Allosphingosinicella sp.]